MTRREGRSPRRDDNPKRASKGGGLLTGLMIGLALGIVMAAGVAWYLTMTPSPMKVVESVPDPNPTPPAKQKSPPAKAEEMDPPPSPEKAAEPPPSPPPVQPQEAPRTAAAPAPRPKVNYTFYGILPGDKPANPMESNVSKDAWWLQIAAISDPRKAEQIRAKLTLLNLPASTQKIEVNGQPLYRIRVGPYKREDEAFGDLDILTQNDFNARLLKDPVNPK